MAGWVQIKSSRFWVPCQGFSHFDTLGLLINQPLDSGAVWGNNGISSPPPWPWFSQSLPTCKPANWYGSAMALRFTPRLLPLGRHLGGRGLCDDSLTYTRGPATVPVHLLQLTKFTTTPDHDLQDRPLPRYQGNPRHLPGSDPWAGTGTLPQP